MVINSFAILPTLALEKKKGFCPRYRVSSESESLAGWKQSIIAFKGQVGTGCEMQGCDAIIHLLFKKDVIEAILEFLKDVIAISFKVKFKLSELDHWNLEK